MGQNRMMDGNEYLTKLLKHYERYYDISTENVERPFAAYAEFRSHNEQYVLFKSAKLSEIDSNEYVYFYFPQALSMEELEKISSVAWERGISKVKPSFSHRNSDVTLVVVSNKIEGEVFKKCRKIKHYKSYKFGFCGWSNFRLVIHSPESKKTATNRLGKDLRKLFA